LEGEGHLLLLDQAPDLLHRLGRAVAVIERDQVDLAAVDAALLIDHLEEGGFRLADGAVGGSRTAVRHGLANLYFGAGDARRIGGDRPRCHRQQRQRRRP